MIILDFRTQYQQFEGTCSNLKYPSKVAESMGMVTPKLAVKKRKEKEKGKLPKSTRISFSSMTSDSQN
jgi:hypothetical protein